MKKKTGLLLVIHFVIFLCAPDQELSCEILCFLLNWLMCMNYNGLYVLTILGAWYE